MEELVISHGEKLESLRQRVTQLNEEIHSLTPSGESSSAPGHASRLPPAVPPPPAPTDGRRTSRPGSPSALGRQNSAGSSGRISRENSRHDAQAWLDSRQGGLWDFDMGDGGY